MAEALQSKTKERSIPAFAIFTHDTPAPVRVNVGVLPGVEHRLRFELCVLCEPNASKVHADAAVCVAQDMRHATRSKFRARQRPELTTVMKLLPDRQSDEAGDQSAYVRAVGVPGAFGGVLSCTTRDACMGGEVMVVPTLAAPLAVQSTTTEPMPML